MAHLQKITPFLWYDNQAQEAASYYCNIFPDSKILTHSPLVSEFQLCGQQFMAINGGPQFKFTEAISLLVSCENQQEVDHYWKILTSDGGEESMCGWLKDRYGLSWQIVPKKFMELMQTGDPEKTKQMMDHMMSMKKLIIQDLEAAYHA